MYLHALVIDPDIIHRSILRTVLSADGWCVDETVSLAEALPILHKNRPSLVFCDLHHLSAGDELNKLNVLQELKRRSNSCVYVIVTAPPGRSTNALEVILNGGASDFIRKPYCQSKITRYSRAVISRLRAASQETVFPLSLSHNSGEAETQQLIGESEALMMVIRELANFLNSGQMNPAGRKVAKTSLTQPSTFFITGETGTGKELIARMIHRNSNYAAGAFVAVNCSTLPAELAESELFGYCAGAFTGATKEKPGLWEAANGGTLFLDEITEAPISMQPKLLRVLQEGTMRRVGSTRNSSVRVQVIATSNRNIKAEIEARRFRRDLYYRLSMYKLHLPPLRERIEDIPMLVEHFARRHLTRHIRFSREALNVLMAYSFPGNVRELENIVRLAVRKSPDGVVYAADLAAYVELMEDQYVSNDRYSNALSESVTTNARPTDISLDELAHRFKLQLIKDALARSGGCVTQAARELKISRPSMYRFLKDIERENNSHLTTENGPGAT